MSTMVSAGLSCVLNIGMNAIFLYTLHMGVLGAGLATLVCRAVPALFMLYLLTKKTNPVFVKIFERFTFDKDMVKRILKLAIPSGIESCLFQLGKLMTSTFVNNAIYNSEVFDSYGLPVWDSNGERTLTNLQADGNTMANSINNIASVVGSGVGTSCLTVIGQAVGTGDPEQCKYYMKKMFLISYIANAVFVGIIMISCPWLLQLYGYSAEAKDVALKCLYFCLSFQFVTYPLSFTTPAILKATSDVRYVMVAAVVSMFTMRVGLSYLMTCEWAGLKLGAFGYWIGMCSDWVLRSILFFSRLLSGRWKKASGLLKDKVDGQVAAAKE
jgi:Na+-driven multidrug efflux pump